MTFDFRAPDYSAVHTERTERLARIRANPAELPALKAWYAEHLADFINDFGVTSDPRNAARGLPVEVPFTLFAKQRELIEFVLERMGGREPGMILKARDVGASWIVASLAGALGLFGRSVVVGIGSRKEDTLDRSGDPATVFWKLRFFLSHLPPEFRGSWDESKPQCSAHLRVNFPQSASSVIGEAGDQIGRGGRSTVYFIDEAAFLERPQLIEASLASNCDCRIDISTPNGRANSFATKFHSGKIKTFVIPWTADPRKDALWYARQCELLDPVTLASEVDLSFDASTEGILIPAPWVHAAIGAAEKLGLTVSGARRGALDVADEGRDRNAFAGRHGILLEHLQSWSGKNSDIYRTVVRTMGICEERGYSVFDYDADGLGAGVRGDAVSINEKRRAAGKAAIAADPFRGSGGVFDPDGSLVEGRANKDYFANLKAMSWWALRLRFQNTYRAVVENMPFEPDDILSIAPELPELTQLVTELSQPTYSVNSVGKIIVDKTPDGALSPNLADAVMIAYGLREGAYFAAPVRAADRTAAAPADAVLPIPAFCSEMFAVMSIGDGAAAVIYVGAQTLEPSAERPPFCLLDWDLKELGSDGPTWVAGTVRRFDELVRQTRAQDWAWFDGSPAEGASELIRECGVEFTDADGLPPPADRFARARPFVKVGLVKLATPAAERVVEFRGVVRNHLRELLDAQTVAQGNPLAAAFATAVLLTFSGAGQLPSAALPADQVEREEDTGATRRALEQKFHDDTAAWESQRDALRAIVREKIRKPNWVEGAWHQIPGLGPPPRNPFAARRVI